MMNLVKFYLVLNDFTINDAIVPNVEYQASSVSANQPELKINALKVGSTQISV